MCVIVFHNNIGVNMQVIYERNIKSNNEEDNFRKKLKIVAVRFGHG